MVFANLFTILENTLKLKFIYNNEHLTVNISFKNLILAIAPWYAMCTPKRYESLIRGNFGLFLYTFV